jgi:hypothetical protein
VENSLAATLVANQDHLDVLVAKERLMKSISDSGKVKIGGGMISLVKPAKKKAKKTKQKK